MREDRDALARLESMLKLVVILLFAFALAAAMADLSRGRRPTLLG